MFAELIYDIAPLGALIAWTNDKPRPLARFAAGYDSGRCIRNATALIHLESDRGKRWKRLPGGCPGAESDTTGRRMGFVPSLLLLLGHLRDFFLAEEQEDDGGGGGGDAGEEHEEPAEGFAIEHDEPGGLGSREDGERRGDVAAGEALPRAPGAAG